MFRSSRSIVGLSVLSSIVVAAMPFTAAGQDAPKLAAERDAATAAEDEGNDLILRTYYVGTLLLNVPDYPYGAGTSSARGRGQGTGVGGGGFGGGGSGGGVFSVADEAGRAPNPYRIDWDVLIDAITRTVAPDTWAENGGGEADIRPVGNALVVLQSPRAHEQIGELLSQLEQLLVDRKTFAVDARWLLLNSEELDRLTPDNDTSGVLAIDSKRLADLTRRPTTIRGLTTCFSGQLVYVVSGTQRNFVSGYIPVVGSLGSPRDELQVAAVRSDTRFRFVSDSTPAPASNQPRVGYQPIVERSSIGALLEIRPTLVRGKREAIVDLRSTLTVPSGQSPELANLPDSVPAPPVVDRITIDTQEFATTLRVSLGKPVLIGGMTYVPPTIDRSRDAASEQPEAAALDNPQFYLVLEVR